MLAKPAPALDRLPADPNGYIFEPKWDGFRGIVVKQGDRLEIASRGSKPLTRYFPELVETFAAQLPDCCMIDGEIILRSGQSGAERLDWPTLAQRIHPAESRVRLLAEQTPASFVAFDLLAQDGVLLLTQPFARRRAALEKLLAGIHPPLHVTGASADIEQAAAWFTEFEGAGLDGVVAKPAGGVYQPGKRSMFKIKHSRTADVVVLGYRIHKSGTGVGSLLLGLYTEDGQLAMAGGAGAFTTKRRAELIEELEPLVARDDDGSPVRGAGEQNRFSSARDTSFTVLRPELVAEVKYDQMEGHRFRHTVQVQRFRPDREPRSCTYAQLDVPVAYDLDQVLTR
jgi:ATP-dependent DNA ligase